MKRTQKRVEAEVKSALRKTKNMAAQQRWGLSELYKVAPRVAKMLMNGKKYPKWYVKSHKVLSSVKLMSETTVSKKGISYTVLKIEKSGKVVAQKKFVN